MDYNNNTRIYQNKENMQMSKVRKESVDVKTPARTPLLNMRNIPASGYVRNIRKTLYGTPMSCKKKTLFGAKGINSNDSAECLIGSPLTEDVLKTVSFAKDTSDGSLITHSGKKNASNDLDKLDQEIEVFVNSILKLTVEEIRKEREIAELTHTQSAVVQETTPRMKEHLSHTPLTTLIPPTSTLELSPPSCVQLTSHSNATCAASKVIQSVVVKPSYADIFSTVSRQTAMTPVKVSCADQLTMTDVSTVSRETAMTPPVKVSCADQLTMTDVSTLSRETAITPPVKVSCADRLTMTNVSTVSRETAMTPIKLPSISGKRLTVDEVRRQHPRVLANYLHTTQNSNEKLRTEVCQVEKERNKLKCVIKVLRASLILKDKLIADGDCQKEDEKSQLEEMHFSVVRDFQAQSEERVDRINSLEDEVYGLKTMLVETETGYHCFKSSLEQRCRELENTLDVQEEGHRNQVSNMDAYFEANNYKSDYEKSLHTVEELQAQLDEFAYILADIQHAPELQNEEVNNEAETLLECGTRREELRKRLLLEYISMQRVKTELLRDVAMCRQENRELHEDCNSLSSSLGITIENMAQLQVLHSNTASDLQLATNLVAQLNSELAAARKVLHDLALSKDVLLNHLVGLSDQDISREVEMTSLRAQVNQVKADLVQEEEAHTDWERIAMEGKAALQEVTSQYELCITNLQRTLDSRDLDIDFMEKDLYECRDVIQEQRHTMDASEKKYASFRESVQHQDQTELTIMKNNIEFLEAERGMLIDTLRDMDEKLRYHVVQQRQQAEEMCVQQRQQAEEMSVQQCQQAEEMSDAQEQLIHYQDTIKNLQAELSDSRLETGCVQMMLLKERDKGGDSLEALLHLEQKMRKILTTLRRKVGIEEGDEQEDETSVHTPVSKRLSAIVHTPPSKMLSANVHTPPSKRLSATVYTPPSKRLSATVHTPPSKRFFAGEATLSLRRSCQRNRSPVSPTASPGEVGRKKLGCSGWSAFNPVARCAEMSLVKRMGVVGDVLSNIISMAHILEEASQLSLQDVKGENVLFVQKVAGLESEVRRLHEERRFQNNEMSDSNQLIEDLKDRIRVMGERIISLSDSHFDNKLLQQEVDRLQSVVKHVHSERDVLAGQLDEVNCRLTGHVPAASRDEVVALQRKNLQMILEITREKDRYYDLETRSERKMKFLDNNWKKAESEVVRFDELMESIHVILKRNSDYISRNPELQRLLQVINGE